MGWLGFGGVLVKTRFLWGKEKSNARDQEDSGTEGRRESHTPRPAHPSPTALGCFYQFRDTGMGYPRMAPAAK